LTLLATSGSSQSHPLSLRTSTVSALARSASAAIFPLDVSVRKTDYSHPSLLDAFKGKDAVAFASATFSTTQQKAIIDAAVSAGVKHFLPSEYSVDTSRTEIYECFPPAVMKGEVAEYLKTKEKDSLSWTAICVEAWFDWVGHLLCPHSMNASLTAVE
jgi:NmrA-like family